MPVEIKELHIRVTVNQPQPAGSAPAGSSAGDAGKSDDKEALIEQCVEQVFDLLKSKNER